MHGDFVTGQDTDVVHTHLAGDEGMDFMSQVQAFAMSHQYENLLKKANFKGGLGSR